MKAILVLFFMVLSSHVAASTFVHISGGAVSDGGGMPASVKEVGSIYGKMFCDFERPISGISVDTQSSIMYFDHTAGMPDPRFYYKVRFVGLGDEQNTEKYVVEQFLSKDGSLVGKTASFTYEPSRELVIYDPWQVKQQYSSNWCN